MRFGLSVLIRPGSCKLQVWTLKTQLLTGARCKQRSNVLQDLDRKMKEKWSPFCVMFVGSSGKKQQQMVCLFVSEFAPQKVSAKYLGKIPHQFLLLVLTHRNISRQMKTENLARSCVFLSVSDTILHCVAFQLERTVYRKALFVFFLELGCKGNLGNSRVRSHPVLSFSLHHFFTKCKNLAPHTLHGISHTKEVQHETGHRKLQSFCSVSQIT